EFLGPGRPGALCCAIPSSTSTWPGGSPSSQVSPSPCWSCLPTSPATGCETGSTPPGGSSSHAHAWDQEPEPSRLHLLADASELQQILAEVRVRVGRPGQAAALQRRDETVGDLDNVLPGQTGLPWAGDEETVPPDCVHDLCHALGDLVRCANELDRPVDPFCRE